METAPGIFYVSLLENVCLCLGEMYVSCMENVCFRLVKTEKNKAFAAYCQGEIKNMLGFALFYFRKMNF